MTRSFLTLLLLSSLTSFSQVRDLKFDHLDNIRALNYRSITAITQDAQGFIWFGSQDGLLRYDGYDVKIFKNEIGNPNSLSDNNIRALEADTLGNIWIATQGGGLSCYITKEERFVNYKNDPENKNSISGNAVWSVMLDSKGILWVGTWSNGLNRFDPATKTFEKIANSADPVLAIHEDEAGLIWYSSNGLSFYNPETKTRGGYSANASDSLGLKSNSIRSINSNGDGKIWVGTDNGGLNVLNKNAKTFTHYVNDGSTNALGGTGVYDIHFDENKLVWLATNSGLDVFDLETLEFSHYKNDPSDPASLSNDQPRAIFQDKTGGLWIGNEGDKINKLLERKSFNTYRSIPGNSNSLSNNLIRSLYEDETGLIWVGTQGGGLNLLDRATGEVRMFEQNDQLVNAEISAIYKDEEGKMWIGTWGGGINIYDPLTGTMDTIQSKPGVANSLPDNRIQVFHKDQFGVFWVGTENGLATYDAFSNQWKKTTHDQLKSTIQGKAFLEDDDGTLYIGTWTGLNKLTPDRTSITTYGLQTENRAGLSSDHVISLHMDADKKLWIGTFGGGLNVLDTRSGSLKSFTEKDGLANNVVFGILEDEENNIWAATNNGLSKFNKTTEQFRSYDASEGLQSNEFYWGASYKNRDGSMMFGGVNGLNIFYPNEIKNNTNVPPVVISDFQIFNRPVGIGQDSLLNQSISFTKELDLDYSHSVLSFSFAALNFNSPEKNQYAYMLEGFDDDWNYVGNKRTATYTNLNAGEYVFKVKGSNNDNVWNEEGVQLTITISPPFWNTWWFYLLVGGALFGVVRIFISYRERSLNHDKAVLEGKIKEAQDEVEKQKQAIAEQRELEKDRIWKDQSIVKLGEVLSRSKDDIKELTQDVLKNVVELLEVPIAALYIAQENEEGETLLNMVANYGYPGAQSFDLGTGLVGECYKEKVIKYIEDLPADYLKIESGLGQSSPSALLLMPLKYEDVIVGVMELASFNQIPEYRREFLEQFSERLTTTINTTLLSEQTKKLLEESKIKEEELKVREEELQQNLEEMQAINEDRDRRTEELESEIAKLKEQIAELKRQNK
ncbi:two-component regulator propeller domain-containing protein [Fulvivirga sp.]|uniref:two-component regulator propeller domain-containing protein n=2 Tax=Fulvivirga sp. TaxID=1931237 RepID=UPI0032ED10F2